MQPIHEPGVCAFPITHGHKKFRERWRVSWSAKPDTWSASGDARSREYRELKGSGLAGVEYPSGKDNIEKAIAEAYINADATQKNEMQQS